MLLEIRNVTKSFAAASGGEAVRVLERLDWSVDAGESVAILGPSGSGKSTLLNLVGALDRPDTGEVWVEGRNLADLGDADLAAYRNETVGFVFQLHHLLPQCSVLENVLVPTLARPGRRPPEVEVRALEVLRAVRLEHRQAHLPGQISGGERQRAAVARALMNRPKLLLADEPTGALDRRTAAELIDLLLELNRSEGMGLIVVTHALEVARRMQRVFEIVDGSLTEVRLNAEKA
jgi:lipoprotein-releasing system ATP-binding protein